MKDIKNTVIAMILIICLVTMMMTILANADDKLRTSARSALVYEPQTQSFPYTKNIDERLPMASATKIMTGIIAIEELDADEEITVPPEACGIEGSSLYLAEGDRITVGDLVYALLLQSANDAATLIALKVSGDLGSFATKMNEKAAELSLSNTHFENPHGLDSDGHYTTARDLARLTAYALENATFRDIVSTYKHSFMVGEKIRTVVNHNKLLKRYEGCIGVKTGYTDKSGRCLVSAAERDGVLLISVTLDAPDDWNDHTKMLDYSFPLYTSFSIDDAAEREIVLPIIGSEKDSITARLDSSDGNIVFKSEDEFDSRLIIRQYAVAPIKKGDIVGSLEITQNGISKGTFFYRAVESADKKRFNILDLFKRG